MAYYVLNFIQFTVFRSSNEIENNLWMSLIWVQTVQFGGGWFSTSEILCSYCSSIYLLSLSPPLPSYIPELGALSQAGVISEIKKLYDQAYQLGVEEAREMTRGKYLNIFSQNNRKKWNDDEQTACTLPVWKSTPAQEQQQMMTSTQSFHPNHISFVLSISWQCFVLV